MFQTNTNNELITSTQFLSQTNIGANNGVNVPTQV